MVKEFGIIQRKMTIPENQREMKSTTRCKHFQDTAVEGTNEALPNFQKISIASIRFEE